MPHAPAPKDGALLDPLWTPREAAGLLAHEFELASQGAHGWHRSAFHQGWTVNPLLQGQLWSNG